jgi:hypothetical protein
MTLQHFYSRRSTQNGGEQRRMINVRIPGERRIQWQETGHRFAGRAGHLHIAHRRAIVQRIDREETRHLLPILVDILEQEAVGPDRQPGIDSLGAEGAVIGIEFAQRLLDALQAVLGDVRHGGAQVQHATPTYRRGTVLHLLLLLLLLLLQMVEVVWVVLMLWVEQVSSRTGLLGTGSTP